MEIKINIQNCKEIASNILVLGIFENQTDFPQEINELNTILDGAITDFVLSKESFKAEYAKSYVLPTYNKMAADKILLVGLGKKESLTLNRLRILAAKIIQKCETLLNKACIDFSLLNFKDTEFAISDVIQVLSEGVFIGSYSFDKYKTKKESDKKVESLVFSDISENEFNFAENGLKMGKIVSTSTNFARDLINEQPQIVIPEKIAEIAQSISNLEVKVYDKHEIENIGMGAFLAVARGSIHEPKFIHLKYRCENPKKKIAIIGKSITFDSGGLDLKPPSSMLTMKDDMSGSAVVLGVMQAIVKLNPNVEVHGIIASCENMISGKAYKPGDVLTAKNKKTIEVDNTDAEGRLTLADALCYAEELGVDEIVDIATLTGACLVALGSVASAIMGNSSDFVSKLIDTSKSVGENLWEMPMYEEYKESLKSDIADMKNTGSRYGGASTAGMFLKNFVDKTTWAHIDIAGTAYLDKPQNEYSKGATGVGIRTLIKYIMSI